MLRRFFQACHYLSFDVILGALLLMQLTSAHLKVSISWVHFLLLAIGIWIIYTIDHLLDSKKVPHTQRARYVFHARHRQKLSLATCVLLPLAAIFACLLEVKIIIFGIILSLFAGLYLLVQQKLARGHFKEIYIAFAYTLGILLCPFVLGELFDVVLFFLLFIAALLNLLIISDFEYEEDHQDGFSSIATILQSGYLDQFIYAVASAGIALVLIAPVSDLSLFFLSIYAIYILIFLKKRWFIKRSRYRYLLDGAFTLPLLWIWL